MLKRTWKKHYIGLAVPQSMVIEMDNTIWQSFYEDAIGVERDIEQAKHWYRLAALQNDDLAIEKCKELGIAL